MTFNYILDPTEYPGQEVTIMLYNLVLMYFMWDVAKYILGIVQQRIHRFVDSRRNR